MGTKHDVHSAPTEGHGARSDTPLTDALSQRDKDFPIIEQCYGLWAHARKLERDRAELVEIAQELLRLHAYPDEQESNALADKARAAIARATAKG